MRKTFAITALLTCLAGSLMAQGNPFLKSQWKNTDFDRISIDLNSVMSGGPGKDGIPSVTDPQMVPIAAADGLGGAEPVMTVELGGQARAYPIRYLMWHEIVNDVVDGTPVAVTFCPLCNSGITFDRRVKGKVLDFGVSGLLRNSDMIMYDRQTESWWQQFTGEGVVGDLQGVKLKKLPSWMESWDTFKGRNPDGLVMAEPNFGRSYGQNPYVGYDTGRPFLYQGENPPHGINPVARVIVIKDKAWPMTRIQQAGSLSESGYTISWASGTASALDGSNIAQSRDVGAIRVRDKNGKDVVHDVAFAFAFHAFNPDGKWMIGN